MLAFLLRLHFLIWAFLIISPALAQEVIIYADATKRLPVGSKVLFLVDSTDQMELHDILQEDVQQSFTRSTQKVMSLGYSEHPVWLKLRVANLTDDDIFLLIDNPIIQHIQFYSNNPDGDVHNKSAGFLEPYHNRDLPHSSYYFKLPSINHELNTYYLRIDSEYQVLLPLIVESRSTYTDQQTLRSILVGFFIGVMFITILLNFLLYTSMKRGFYLYHMVRTLALLLVFDVIVNSVLFQVFYPGSPGVNLYLSSFEALTLAAEIAFCRAFLKTKWTAPTLDGILYYLTIAAFVPVVIDLAGFHTIGSAMFSALAIGSIVVLLITGVKVYQTKYTGSIFYLIGTGSFLCTAMLYLLMINNLMPAFYNFNQVLILGAVVDIVVTSLGFTYRIRKLRDAKRVAQQEAIRLVKEHNEELEQKVAERTEEIERQNKAILSKNEELLAQHDTIKNQNDQLEHQNTELKSARKIIQDQNQRLKKYNEDLEAEIALRTGELQKTNDELIKHYHQLEQFSFITAHNLRAPVARLLGLINLLSNKYQQQIDEHTVKEKIAETTKHLDDVIRDINSILEIRRGSKKVFEEVSLKDQIDRLELIMEEEIRNSRTTIETDFSAAPTLASIPAYIESIFYNLISNSIKYRANHRDPKIIIRSDLTQDIITITYTDNGIGLNMKKFRDKIFGLYQRFNVTVEGKGLGLHLVKSQIEALGGTIFVSSEEDKGMHFTIMLPNGHLEHHKDHQQVGV